MNWYNLIKQSQQHLLFNPFNSNRWDRTFDIEPTTRDESGYGYHECSMCHKLIHEDDVNHWSKSRGVTRDYFYPDIDKDKIFNICRTISQSLQIILEKSKLHDTSQEEYFLGDSYEKNPNHNPFSEPFNIYQVLGSDWVIFNDICSKSRSEICELKDKDTFSLNDVYRFNEIITTPDIIAQRILDNINENEKTFNVNLRVAICDECAETLPTCSTCGEPITEEDANYHESKNYKGELIREYVCQQCLDRGTGDFCMECGEVVTEDYKQYDEETGGYLCNRCFEKKPSSLEDFEDEISRLASKNTYPFKSWFGKSNRIFLNYDPDSKMAKEDKEIIQLLNDNGYTLTDEEYKQGYCTKEKRKLRIGRELERIYKKKQLEISADNSQEDIIKLKDAFKNYNMNFQISKYRSGDRVVNESPDDLVVMISQDPYDMAMMSTGQNWESCMQLGRGEMYHDLFDEIESGGLVAYLLKREDIPQGRERLEKKVALGRIAIRRYVNREGENWAVPEKGHYGYATNWFHNLVNSWLAQKQKDLPKGTYTREGGSYSDSLKPTHEKVAKRISSILKTAGVSTYVKIGNLCVRN